jgi:hypothetical protein
MVKIAIIGNHMETELIRFAIESQGKIVLVPFNQTESPFDKEPLQFFPVPKPKLPGLTELKDKKGKPLPLPKSKFHK